VTQTPTPEWTAPEGDWLREHARAGTEWSDDVGDWFSEHPTGPHYHVLLFQDFGGTQEYARGWDEKLTAEQAVQLATDAIAADAYYRGDTTELDPFVFDAGIEAKLLPRYGEKWTSLRSDNTAPG
jgi:hypothetical protein